MTVLCAAAALSIVVRRLGPGLGLFPLSFAAGFLWAGPVVAFPLGLFGICLPLSSARLLSNIEVRRSERAVLRSLEAMLERAHLSSQATDVLACGGAPIARILAPDSPPSWLSRSLQRVFDGSAVSGAPLGASLVILLDEARSRVELLHEMRSRASALVNVTLAFVAVEFLVSVVVLLHPGWSGLFRHGTGAALGAWVILSTTALLGLPWLQAEVSAW